MNRHATTRVLVAYASKMGGTEEIAHTISHELRTMGFSVVLAPAKQVDDVGEYDAIVLGSAVYAGRWRTSAVRLLHRVADASGFAGAPRVWLFQSGPLDAEELSLEQPAPHRVAALAATAGTATPKTFGGRLDAQTARGFLASRMAHGEHAGDFRDMAQVAAWARLIAESMDAPADSLKRPAEALKDPAESLSG